MHFPLIDFRKNLSSANCRRYIAGALLAVSALTPPATAEIRFKTTDTGQIQHVTEDGVKFDVKTDVRVPTSNWKNVLSLDDLVLNREDGAAQDAPGEHSGHFPLENGTQINYHQEITSRQNRLKLRSRIQTGDKLPSLEGAYLVVNFPVEK